MAKTFLSRRYSISEEEIDEELIEIFIDGFKYGKTISKSDVSKPKKAIANSWRKDYSIYRKDLLVAFSAIRSDSEWVAKYEAFYPGVDIIATIEKSIFEFWDTPEGWKRKKQTRGAIDWRRTFSNALSMRFNQVLKKTTGIQGRGFAV